MFDRILASAKAVAGLLGAILTSVLATVPADGQLFKWLSLASAIATGIAVYTVPNTPRQTPDATVVPPSDQGVI